MTLANCAFISTLASYMQQPLSLSPSLFLTFFPPGNRKFVPENIHWIATSDKYFQDLPYGMHFKLLSYLALKTLSTGFGTLMALFAVRLGSMCRWSCSHTRWKAVLGPLLQVAEILPSQFRPCVLLMFHVVYTLRCNTINAGIFLAAILPLNFECFGKIHLVHCLKTGLQVCRSIWGGHQLCTSLFCCEHCRISDLISMTGNRT